FFLHIHSSALFSYTTLFRSNFVIFVSFCDIRWPVLQATRLPLHRLNRRLRRTRRVQVIGVEVNFDIFVTFCHILCPVLQVTRLRSEEHTSELQSPYDVVCHL